MLGRPALQKQHGVVLRDVKQFAHVGLGLLGHLDEGLAAVTDLHDRDAATVPVEHLDLACSSTSSGNVAGPALKLNIRPMSLLHASGQEK